MEFITFVIYVSECLKLVKLEYQLIDIINYYLHIFIYTKKNEKLNTLNILVASLFQHDRIVPASIRKRSTSPKEGKCVWGHLQNAPHESVV